MPVIDKTSTSTVFNGNTINPRDLTLYNAFRGVTDFTNVNQFSQFESGYQGLFVLQMPWFMEQLEPTLTESFRHMLEYEFQGLDGLPDYSTDTMTISDGINELRLINKVTYDSSVTVQSRYFEKTGSLITRWSEMYLTGIKDKNSQAKTYHGLIKNGKCPDPGPDKEIFTMLYIVTDNTMYRLERAVLLANCQLTKAETSIYNGQRSDINNKDMQIEWNCFPIMSNAVDAAAKRVLEKVNGIGINYTSNGSGRNDGGLIGDTYLTNTSNDYSESGQAGKIVYSELDSTEYEYGIMFDKSRENKNAFNKSEGLYNPTDLGKYFTTKS